MTIGGVVVPGPQSTAGLSPVNSSESQRIPNGSLGEGVPSQPLVEEFFW